jgi:hypothetical protein
MIPAQCFQKRQKVKFAKMKKYLPFVFILCGQFTFSEETLRGGVYVELEPVYAQFLGVPYPLDDESASLWAVEDAAAAFSAMIYGWSFTYEPGEKARGLNEMLDLSPLGGIETSDTKLKITDVNIKDDILYMQADYYPDEAQKSRIRSWNSARTFSAQAVGYGPLQGQAGITVRSEIKEAALKDAMKKAIRKKLRVTERNRPLAALGFIALSKFPLYRMQNGMWAATAEFRIEIKEIIPFAAY